ncbi:MAG: DUF4258 domain-containing protein [Candidatus Rokubacteria bacterium]|nr:DUF4258 domain-containing protein [Candidatus Rokubacteria bacterium]
MRRYVFTVHAKERMRLRGITEAMVKETVEQPERTGTGYRLRRLKVVYTEEGARAVIISTIWE